MTPRGAAAATVGQARCSTSPNRCPPWRAEQLPRCGRGSTHCGRTGPSGRQWLRHGAGGSTVPRGAGALRRPMCRAAAARTAGTLAGQPSVVVPRRNSGSSLSVVTESASAVASRDRRPQVFGPPRTSRRAAHGVRHAGRKRARTHLMRVGARRAKDTSARGTGGGLGRTPLPAQHWPHARREYELTVAAAMCAIGALASLREAPCTRPTRRARPHPATGRAAHFIELKPLVARL
jgi:hypothetical protein